MPQIPKGGLTDLSPRSGPLIEHPNATREERKRAVSTRTMTSATPQEAAVHKQGFGVLFRSGDRLPAETDLDIIESTERSRV